MNHEKKLRYLHDLYDRIPPAPCAQCGWTCCFVPFQVSDFEKDLLPGNNFDGEGPCAFVKDGKCSVYETRPFICRIYNASPWLGCDKVEKPNMLSPKEAGELYMDYYTLFWNAEQLNRWRARQKEALRDIR